MKSFKFAALAISFLLAFSWSQVCQAEMVYSLRTETTNADDAKIVSGFFKTNGTIGTDLALGDILVDYSIEIMESGMTSTLNSLNSTITKNSAFFDVTGSSITLTGGSGSFAGFQVNADANNNIRYAALRTSGTTNVFVSLDSGTRTGQGGSGPFFTGGSGNVLVAVPEPTSAALFGVAMVCGLVRRRRN